MAKYKFPTDYSFRKKAAFIADKVLYAINMHKVKIDPVYNDPKNCCPLACLDLSKEYHYPGSTTAFLLSKNNLSLDDTASFIQGFDGRKISKNCIKSMYHLGKAYRKKFSQ